MRKEFIGYEFSLIDDHADGHIVVYEVSVGWFILRMEVLNMEGLSPSFEILGKGNFGVVIPAKIGKQEMVVKRMYPIV